MNANNEDMDITLSLLQSIAERANITQRSLAKRLGLALGLTNSYLRACIKDGLIKIEQIPANKYLYYLTPKGFAHKSKLMATYLNASLRIFRDAQLECSQFLSFCVKNGLNEIAVIGENDLSDIACLIASNNNLQLSKLSSLHNIAKTFDAWIIVDTKSAQDYYDLLAEQFSLERIFCFSVLKVKQRAFEESL